MMVMMGPERMKFETFGHVRVGDGRFLLYIAVFLSNEMYEMK